MQKKIFVSYKELEGIPQKYNNKLLEIGNIVREDIINFKNTNVEKNKIDKIKILVLGSQAQKFSQMSCLKYLIK